jgi:hypothetical protein
MLCILYYYSVITVTLFKILICFPFQPNRVANHILSPLVMSVFGKSLRCMKLLIEVQ